MPIIKAKRITKGPIAKKLLGPVVKRVMKVAKTIKKRSGVRAKYVTQPAKMSKETWKKLQIGMGDKWPQPKYMAKKQEDVSSTCYMDETYMEITRWTSDTKIQYRPHAKSPGSKSHIRYEKYSKAKTVAEALKLGSWPADWCWDYERGFIKVVGGRLRSEPIDSTEAETKNLDEVDRVVAKWFIREAARMLGMTLDQLRDDAEAKDLLLLRMKRKIAEDRAVEVLTERAKSGRKLTEQDVLSVLQHWGFRKNVTRPNVTPEGQGWVFSDTLGLVADRKGTINPTKYTLAYPNVTKVICSYVQDNLPKEIPAFSFTGINVNKNYAGKRHRDGNNVGPSIIKALGNFTGGKLNYFPNDDRALQLEDLPESDRVSLDLKHNWALFDGRRAHQVDPFKGERFSLVYFTCPRNDRVDKETKRRMEECGFPMPTAKSQQFNMNLMAAPSGYGVKTKQQSKYKAGDMKYLTWVPCATAQGSKRARG